VSLHSISSRLTSLFQGSSLTTSATTSLTRLTKFCWVSSDTELHCFEASLRSARLPGLLVVGPTRLLAAMLGDLGVSTLRSTKTMTQFSSLLSIKPMFRDYSTSASSTTSCFPRRTDLLGNMFLIMSLLDLLFFFLSLLDHHTGHPACHDARILPYECIFDALLISLSLF
jgi:hypothetical protein